MLLGNICCFQEEVTFRKPMSVVGIAGVSSWFFLSGEWAERDVTVSPCLAAAACGLDFLSTKGAGPSSHRKNESKGKEKSYIKTLNHLKKICGAKSESFGILEHNSK